MSSYSSQSDQLAKVGSLIYPEQSWHNALPRWITSSPAYHRLRQGPRQTLQCIANRCDAAPASDAPGSSSLLVAFGGDRLIKEAGCSRATFRRHVQLLIRVGFIAKLSWGNGRLADIYGIPGTPGELDGHQASKDERRGTGPGGRWTHHDTATLRAALDVRLESQIETLGQVSKRDTRTSLKIRPQGYQNETLPSPSSSQGAIPFKSPPLPSAESHRHNEDSADGPTRKRADKSQFRFDDDESRPGAEAPHLENLGAERALALTAELPDGSSSEQIKAALVSWGVHGGRAYKLSLKANPAVVREAIAAAEPRLGSVGNPGGYLAELVEQAVEDHRQAEVKRRAQAQQQDADRRQAAFDQIDTMSDAELAAAIHAAGFPDNADNTPANIRKYPMLRKMVADYLARYGFADPAQRESA